MSRTLTSLLAATAQIAIIAVGVPVWAIVRVGSPLLPLQTFDIALVMSLGLWVLLAKAIIERSDPVDPAAVSRHSLQSTLHRLVDRSWFGVAMIKSEFAKAEATSARLAESIAFPTVLSADELPQQIPLRQLDHNLHHARAATTTDVAVAQDLDPAGHGPIPTLRTTEPEQPLILATETYTVARGDTYWSIAEVTLGDGRLWTAIQDLNLGREVAPGISLNTNHELSIGWSVLVPLTATEDDEN